MTSFLATFIGILDFKGVAILLPLAQIRGIRTLVQIGLYGVRKAPKLDS